MHDIPPKFKPAMAEFFNFIYMKGRETETIHSQYHVGWEDLV